MSAFWESLGLGLADGIMQQGLNQWNMYTQFNYQKQLMQMQNDLAISNWNMQNEYNKPTAQLERLRDAGINPNSIFGGSVSNSASSLPGGVSAPSAPSGGSPNIDLQHAVDSGINEYLLGAQERNIEADTRSKNANAQGQELSNDVFLHNWNIDLAIKKANLDISKETLNKLQFEVNVLLPQQEESNEQMINNLMAAGRKMAEEINLIRKNQNLVDAQIDTQKAQQGVLAAQQGLLGEEENKVKKEAQGIEYENAVKKVSANLASKYGIDPSKLDALEHINVTLYEQGFTEEQIEDFWEATRGDLSSRFWNALAKTIDNPSGVVKTVSNLSGKGKFRGKTRSSTRLNNGRTSTTNPKN